MNVILTRNECVICLEKMPKNSMWRYMGARCISPHAVETREEYRHDLHFHCYLDYLKRTLTSGNDPKCPSCAVVLNNSDIVAFAQLTLYKYGSPNSQYQYNNDPRDQSFNQKIVQLGKDENIQPMLRTIVEYIDEKTLKPCTE